MKDQFALLAQQRRDLMTALAAMLRQTANPDPLHPAWKEARDKATKVYHDVAATMPNPPN